MLGLKRRTRVEGWALDVSDGEEVGYKSTIQRIGDNNKLWVAALIILLVVSAFLMHQAKGGGKGEKPLNPHQARINGAYRNQDHQDFAKEFVRDKGKGGQIIEARFVDDRNFAFVVPGETGADDIEYLSKMAAELHRARFHCWVNVKAYQRSAVGGRDVLRATTSWVASRYGFVVKFLDVTK